MTTRRSRGLALLLLVTAFVVAPSLASAHGDLEGSRPAADAKLSRPPDEVRLTFTEPPTEDARVEVRDPCGDQLVGGVDVKGNEVRASLLEGRPGRWLVSYRTVSSVDGHIVSGSYVFRVRGITGSCEEPAPTPSDTPTTVPSETGTPTPPAPSDDGGLPTGAIVGGAVGLVALALAVRLLAGRA